MTPWLTTVLLADWSASVVCCDGTGMNPPPPTITLLSTGSSLVDEPSTSTQFVTSAQGAVVSVTMTTESCDDVDGPGVATAA